MDNLWRVIFCVSLGGIGWLLHRWVGDYPAPLPRSPYPRKDILWVIGLWGMAFIAASVMSLLITPWLEAGFPNPIIQEWIRLPLLTSIYVLLPMMLHNRNGWNPRELGLTLHSQSKDVSIFAILFGLSVGGIAFLTGQSNIEVEPIPAGALLLLVYNNSFIEEFFYRGIIQSALERSCGQKAAVLWGGILFGIVHIVFDISTLLESQGICGVLLAVVMQSIAGWILGIIYMKTRSLLPGIFSHYLGNWLPSILAGM